MHNLEPVAFIDTHFTERASRHDLEVALHRDLARAESQLGDHIGYRNPDRHMAKITVHVDRDAFLELHRAPQ